MENPLAPGWQIRCPKCGKVGPYLGIRLWAASKGKRIGIWCRTCRWFRMSIVERIPEPQTPGNVS